MTDPCIEHPGRCNEKGYGYVWFRGKSRRAHRVAWERAHGPIPAGMCVLHRCDNPPCVNVEHLFLGTQLDNIADRDAKGRTVAPPSRRKLSFGVVAELRAAHAAGATQQELANRYGVSRGNVSKIVNGRSYV